MYKILKIFNKNWPSRLVRLINIKQLDKFTMINWSFIAKINLKPSFHLFVKKLSYLSHKYTTINNKSQVFKYP